MQEHGSLSPSAVPAGAALCCAAVAVQGAVGTPPGAQGVINTLPARSLQSQSLPCSASVVLCLGWLEWLPAMKPPLFPQGGSVRCQQQAEIIAAPPRSDFS